MRELGLLPAAEGGYKVLILSGTHGLRPTQARLARVRELARALAARGVKLHILLLAERQLRPLEIEHVRALRSFCHEIEVITHPANDSLLYRTWLRFAEMLPGPWRERLGSAGGERHCPRRLLRILRTRFAVRNYAVVVACGVHLARALEPFSQWTLRVLDLSRVASASHASHRSFGRADTLREFATPSRELGLLKNADAVLVRCSLDAVELRSAGYAGDLVLAPPVADLVTPEQPVADPPRPPRLLCVGSETTANLDGLRWLRREVYPRILRSVPTCRLRVVGEAARHVEPDVGVDRIGWVDDLEDEYRSATVVALPLRMGSGMRRRAIEALATGRALATTTTGAHGLRLKNGQHAIVEDDASALAAAIIRALTDDAYRGSLESQGFELMRSEFGSARSMEPLFRFLGLPILAPPEIEPEPVLV